MASNRLIRIASDLRSVETHRPDVEVPPQELGLSRDATNDIWEATRDLYRTRVHPAISLCIRHRGEILLDRAIGHASGNGPDDPTTTPVRRATPDTPFCIFSASKAVTAILIHHLDDTGALHIDDRVCTYIPEFARNGKQWITIRHLLTHRAGIPSIPDAGRKIDLLNDDEALLRELCATRPASRPGRRLAYHAITGGFILGEIVRRATQQSIRDALEQSILTPMGLTTMNYGATGDTLRHTAYNYDTGAPVRFPVTEIVRRALGVSLSEAVAYSNDHRYLTAVVPAGNIVATANDACRFFQMLLDDGMANGRMILDARTIRRATNESAYLEMDFTLGLPVRYGLGLMLGAKRLSPFGPDTQHAFGHLGFINIMTWADPSRHLSAALLTSGKPLIGNHLIALYRLLATISTRVPSR